jgi:peptidoglycan biosynthesis protein MviN/MurJ (putative lipid II flippase)
VNTWNLYAALACTAVLSLVLGASGLGAYGLALAAAAGFTVLGALTVSFLWRSLRFDGAHIHAASAVVLNVTAALITLMLRSVLLDRWEQTGMLLTGAGLCGVLLLGYLLALRRLEVRWVIEVETRLLRRGRSGRRQ